MRSTHAGKEARVSLTKITEIIDSELISGIAGGKYEKEFILIFPRKNKADPRFNPFSPKIDIQIL